MVALNVNPHTASCAVSCVRVDLDRDAPDSGGLPSDADGRGKSGKCHAFYNMSRFWALTYLQQATQLRICKILPVLEPSVSGPIKYQVTWKC